MAYIGAQPRLGNFQACDAITASATTTFNLLVGGVAIFPQTAQHCLVSLNGVLQAPISSYTISGSTIVFASALTSADSIDFITILGDTLDLGTPSDSTVTTAKLNTAVLTGATDIGAAIADADLFLVDDGAGGTLRKTAASRIKTYVGGGITMADNWRITADIADTGTVTANWERNDNISSYIGSGMSESSGIFTFPSTGIYFVSAQSYVDETFDGALAYCGIQIMGSTNGSSITAISQTYDSSGAQNRHMSLYCSAIYDVTNTSNNNIRLNLDHSGTSGTDATYGGNSTHNYTALTFIRLGDT